MRQRNRLYSTRRAWRKIRKSYGLFDRERLRLYFYHRDSYAITSLYLLMILILSRRVHPTRYTRTMHVHTFATRRALKTSVATSSIRDSCQLICQLLLIRNSVTDSYDLLRILRSKAHGMCPNKFSFFL